MRAREITSQIDMQSFTLPMNTLLYHGTNATTDFDMFHDRPSWFTLDKTQALEWRSWHQSDERNQGTPRTLEFVTIRKLLLWDMRGNVDDIIMHLVGDLEVSPYHLARSLPEGFDGWIAENEVMIIDPVSALKIVKKSY